MILFIRPWTPRYNFSKINGREANLDVPARIHFVWLGQIIPEKYLENINTFKNLENYEVRQEYVN